MILQNLVFPNQNCSETELYYRKTGQELRFDTYFNVFLIDKWRRYTSVQEVFLCLEAEGEFDVEVFDDKGILKKRSFSFEKRDSVQIAVPYRISSTAIYFSFRPRCAGARLIAGFYMSPQEANRRIRIAAGICTYHRERFLLRNIKQIKETILDNKASVLNGKLMLVISDNGRSLSIEQEHPDIKIFYNCNAGGSGGFARTMLEMMRIGKHEFLSHMIFMDDDILLEPEALIRTYTFLSLLKKEHEALCLSGAMLRSDRKYILQKPWTLENAFQPEKGVGEVDLREKANILAGELYEQPPYAPWWFACYPLNIAGQAGLPLPFFVHMDDIEYSLRLKLETVSLNGICVWHEAFENKKSSPLVYYDIRNLLIVAACYERKYSWGKVNRLLLRRMAAAIFRYRYKDVELLCRGVEDFCRGVDWLKKQQPELLHKEISKAGYQLHPWKGQESILEEDFLAETPSWSKWNTFTLNGWLFPAKKGRVCACPLGVGPAWLYRKKNVFLYDPDSLEGILLKKSYRQASGCLIRYVKMLVKAGLYYRHACREYRTRLTELMEAGFWEQYLNLPGNYDKISMENDQNDDISS